MYMIKSMNHNSKYSDTCKQQSKDKAKTYKSNPKVATFQRKIAALGGTWTHDLKRSRGNMYA